MATTEERDIFNNEYVQIYTNGSGNIVLLFQNEVEKTLALAAPMTEREFAEHIAGLASLNKISEPTYQLGCR